MIIECEPYACIECGKHEAAKYLNNEKMVSRRLCFFCNFWTNHANNPNGIRVNGKHYTIGAEHPKTERHLRGFCGDKFHFRKHDGAEIVSTNVWFQGDIPERFRERMPDNAVIVEGKR